MPKGETRKFVRATSGFVVAASGNQSRGIAIKGGQILEASNPLVRKHPDLFEDLEDDAVTMTETAMQRPGEGRAVTSKKARSVLAAVRAKKAADVEGDG